MPATSVDLGRKRTQRLGGQVGGALRLADEEQVPGQRVGGDPLEVGQLERPVGGLEVLDRVGTAGSRLGHPELEQDPRARAPDRAAPRAGGSGR